MGFLQINGGALSLCPDPTEIDDGNGLNAYGVQGNRLVFGPFENKAMHWSWLFYEEYAELKARIDGTNGARVAITIPVGSPDSWTTHYANLRLTGGTRRRRKVYGVTLEITRANTSPS